MINTKLCVGSVGKRQQNKDFEVGIAIFAVSIFGIYPNQKECPSDSLNQWGGSSFDPNYATQNDAKRKEKIGVGVFYIK